MDNRYYFNKKENQFKIGIDQGYNKLISDSNGVHWGKDLKNLLAIYRPSSKIVTQDTGPTLRGRIRV